MYRNGTPSTPNLRPGPLPDFGTDRMRTPITPINSEDLERSVISQRTVERVRYSIVPGPADDNVGDIETNNIVTKESPVPERIFVKSRSFTEAFFDLPPTVKNEIHKLSLERNNPEGFHAIFRNAAGSNPLFMSGLRNLMEERVINMPPEFMKKGDSSNYRNQWVVVGCDALESSFPMIHIKRLGQENEIAEEPVAVPFRIVFLANSIERSR